MSKQYKMKKKTKCKHEKAKAEKDMIGWIKKASYRELLDKWRYAPTGDPFFSGKVGFFYTVTMQVKRDAIGNFAHTAISKSIDSEHAGFFRTRQLKT